MAPPRVQIPIHVFGFGLATLPGIIYAIYWQRNYKSTEELEEELQKSYSSQIQGTRDKRDDMIKLVQDIKSSGRTNMETEKNLNDALKGGRGQAKRHFAVDEKLYGKEKGTIEQQEAEEERKMKLIQEKRKQRKKAVVKKSTHEDTDKNLGTTQRVAESALDSENKSAFRVDGINAKSIAAVAFAGIFLTAAGIFFGGKRS